MSKFYENEKHIIPYAKVSHIYKTEASVTLYFTDGERMTWDRGPTAKKIIREVEEFFTKESCYSNSKVFFRFSLVTNMRLSDFFLYVKMENYKQSITIEKESSMNKVMEDFRTFLGEE